MGIMEVFLIAIGMAMDAFAVCLGAGTQDNLHGTRPAFRMAFHFGLFQFIMPVVGWFAGSSVAQLIQSFDHWVAFGLLAFVGGRMIWSGFHPDEDENKKDLSRGWTMVALSIAVSIDALAVGLSMGLVGIPIWYPAIVIGLVTGFLSLLGLQIGNRLGEKFGKVMEIVGGLILVGIGLRILLEHVG